MILKLFIIADGVRYECAYQPHDTAVQFPITRTRAIELANGDTLILTPSTCVHYVAEESHPLLIPKGELDSYVQTVPDHCDRILWRNKYYALSLLEPSVEPFVTRYDWTQAPEWVNYIATDYDGTVCGFTNTPSIAISSTSGYWGSGGSYTTLSHGATCACEDWRNSLEARPK